ncbi:LamG-like jellyroll fold domain-containing protein [Streptomyces clavifer]|uniref:LamG-like jellyroll fold domain-containing protein n=1 Tax=Streptomyces clavifer TaxID=68188 RepID=UPI003090EBD5|nr:LamG domain-containing protein [Streptomyces clavifer]
MPILVEMGWGGLVQAPWSITWTDISTRVDMVQGVTISRGASDELSETQPGTATLTLDNQDGWLTPGNPNSGYFPFVRRNAPIRISQAVMPAQVGAAPWPLAQMGDDFDDEVIDPTLWPGTYGAPVETGGRIRIPCVSGTPAGVQSARSWTLDESHVAVKASVVPAASTSSAATMALRVTSTTAGTRLAWQYDAVTGQLRACSDVASADAGATVLTYSAIDHAWWRIREAGSSVLWETSPDGWEWTVRRTLATPAWVTSQQQQVELDATRTGGGTADYAEFDLLGAAVRPRFWGMVNEFPVEWEGLYSSVTVSATDLFKRLNRLPEMRSMLGMEVLTSDTLTGVYSFLAAYYPLTEEVGAAAAGDVAGLGTGALAVTQVSAGGTLEFGTDGVPETGESCPTFTPASASAGRYLVADLGPQAAEDSTTWLPHVQVWFKTSTVSRVICGLHDPNVDHELVFVLSASGVLQIEHSESGDARVTVTTASGNLANGVWHHLVYDGSTKRVYIDGAAVGGTLSVSGMGGLRTLYVGGYRAARLFSGQIAHVSLHEANSSAGAVYAATYGAMTGFAPEVANLRVERLARYAGLASVTILGSTHDQVASQGPAGSGVVARLREVESTESGRLYAERDYYGLAYQSRDLRYNPDPAAEVFTIDYADLDTQGVQLADDDQKLVNEVTASRPGGATQTVTAPSSILAFGTYPQQLTILKTSDLSVMDAAYWRVSRYANPEPELREVPIEAATMPTFLDILDADISSYFTVFNLPAQATASSMRVTVEGYTETIKEQSHVIQFRTSASARDSVWILGDTVYGVLGTTTRLAY